MSRKKRYWNDSHIHIVKKVIRNKELHLKPKYVWNCRLHLNDDCNFFSWPFDFFSLLFFSANCSIFLHIFFLVICSKRFALFFFIYDHFEEEKKKLSLYAFCNEKKRNGESRKIAKKIINFFVIATRDFSPSHCSALLSESIIQTTVMDWSRCQTL